MDERVWSITKIGAVRPSIKFEGDMRLVTVKNIDNNKTGKIWLDSRWKQSWHKFDNLNVGDLISNLHSIKGYKEDTLNADSLVITKRTTHKQSSLLDEPLVVSTETYCEDCNLISRQLQRHLNDVHKVSLFNDRPF